jgi:hypothetical protein
MPSKPIVESRAGQNFQGFALPTSNTTYTPNQFFDVCLPHYSRGCMRIVAMLIRQTLGWCNEDGDPQVVRHRASLADFQEAGISRDMVRSSIKEAIDGHFIRCVRQRRLTVFAEKTGMKRQVPIVPKLYAILLEVFEQAEEAQTLVCNVSVFCLWRNFTVIRKTAGLPKWKDAFQVMRRNCETDWAQRFPQFVVSEWIGHALSPGSPGAICEGRRDQ